MHIVAVGLLLAFVVQAHARGLAMNLVGHAQKSMDTFIDELVKKLVGKLFDRTPRTSPIFHTKMDTLMLKRLGHLAIPIHPGLPSKNSHPALPVLLERQPRPIHNVKAHKLSEWTVGQQPEKFDKGDSAQAAVAESEPESREATELAATEFSEEAAATAIVVHRRPLLGALLNGMASGPAAAAVSTGVTGTEGLLVATVQDRILLTNTPKLDRRQYQWAKLSNGLETVNVQDPTATSNGFAMAVQAGSFYDPKELQGLAHFCEHMLFLGTQKYPQPSGFNQFLSVHGGSSNAYTSVELTVYFAQLDLPGFNEGLDRFADFFRAPLFDETYVQREVNAIDSEHAKNKQSPDRRVIEVMQSLADPRSPVSAFHTGDIETLYNEPKARGTNPVDALKTYYAENYCTQRMRLVTFSSSPVDKQLQEVIEKFSSFEQRSNCQAVPRSFATPIAFPLQRLGKWIHMLGTRPQPQLWIFFNLPDLTQQYRTHPLVYLRHVLDYNGVDSLSQTLKDNLGVATSLDVSIDSSSAGTKFFVIATLTPKGAEHPEIVLDSLFAYIAEMKQRGVDDELYSSIADIAKLDWEWSEDAGTIKTVQTMAEQMTRLPKEDILTGDYLISERDTGLVTDLLNLLTPYNMNVAFTDPNFKDGGDTLTLAHYGVKYRVSDLDQHLPASSQWGSWLSGSVSKQDMDSARLRNLRQLDPDITTVPNARIPEAIRNIPKKITLDFAKAPLGRNDITALFGEKPVRVEGSIKENYIWYRQGSTSQNPRVILDYLIRNQGSITLAPNDAMVNTMYLRMLVDQLDPKLVDLAAAGMSCQISVGSHSLKVSFSGFKQLLQTMMDLVTKEVQTGVDISQIARFNRIKQSVREELADKSGQPFQYAIQDRNIMVTENMYATEELQGPLNSITPEMLEHPTIAGIDGRPSMFTSLTMGNIERTEAIQASERFSKLMNISGKLASDDVEIVTPVVHPKVPVELRKFNPRKNDPNHVTVVSIMLGVLSISESVVWAIMSQVLGRVAYDELRTRNQLGYVVSGGVGKISNTAVLSVVVQGIKKGPDETEASIDMVLTKLMPERLRTLTDDEFNSYKEAFTSALLKPPLGLAEEVSYYLPSVAALGQCFEKRQDQLKYLRTQLTSKNQLIDAYMRAVLPESRSIRSRLAIKYFSQDRPGLSIPVRPDLKTKKAQMKTAGVPPEGIAQAELEYEETQIFTKADSSIRSSLASEFGYFPTTFCP